MIYKIHMTAEAELDLQSKGLVTTSVDTILDFIGSFGEFDIRQEHDSVLSLDTPTRNRVFVSYVLDSPLGTFRGSDLGSVVYLAALRALQQKKKSDSILSGSSFR